MGRRVVDVTILVVAPPARIERMTACPSGAVRWQMQGPGRCCTVGALAPDGWHSPQRMTMDDDSILSRISLLITREHTLRTGRETGTVDAESELRELADV